MSSFEDTPGLSVPPDVPDDGSSSGTGHVEESLGSLSEEDSEGPLAEEESAGPSAVEESAVPEDEDCVLDLDDVPDLDDVSSQATSFSEGH
jgi:hypothetical protein